MAQKKTIYLAGPYGFSEIGQVGITVLKEILHNRFHIIDPFLDATNQNFGQQIAHLQEKLREDPPSLSSLSVSYQRLVSLSNAIGDRNANLLNSCDLVFALLDGPDVDSGTAAEIGFAYAQGKQIWGYRGDFRLSSDNLGCIVNLQVEWFIRNSGGRIFHSFQEIQDHLDEINVD